eukprot:SAG11_NODE_494_length_8948_cov_2.882699_11_plen_254_part_00
MSSPSSLDEELEILDLRVEPAHLSGAAPLPQSLNCAPPSTTPPKRGPARDARPQAAAAHTALQALQTPAVEPSNSLKTPSWAMPRAAQRTNENAYKMTDLDPQPESERLRQREHKNAKRPPPGVQITPNNSASWELFKSLDSDCSGLLDPPELRQLLHQQLGLGPLATRRAMRELKGYQERERKIQLSMARTTRSTLNVREHSGMGNDSAKESGGVQNGTSFREFANWWNRQREVCPPFHPNNSSLPENGPES